MKRLIFGLLGILTYTVLLYLVISNSFPLVSTNKILTISWIIAMFMYYLSNIVNELRKLNGEE
jgi:hypothetical protein